MTGDRRSAIENCLGNVKRATLEPNVGEANLKKGFTIDALQSRLEQSMLSNFAGGAKTAT